MEGVLRVFVGAATPEEFMDWLSAPGLAEIERLNGTPTIEIARKSLQFPLYSGDHSARGRVVPLSLVDALGESLYGAYGGWNRQKMWIGKQ